MDLRRELPQDWAWTNVQFAGALVEQAQRAQGDEAEHLFDEGIGLLHQALEIWTRQTAPAAWAETQDYLGVALRKAQRWTEASQVYMELTEFAPTDQKFFSRRASVCEDGLHDYAKARALREEWLKSHENDIWTKAELAKSYFEEGRFRECVERARETRKLLAKVAPTLAADIARYRAAMRVLELAGLAVGTSDTAAPFLLEDLKTELAKLPADFQLHWEWTGIRYFIENSDAPELAPRREWLLALIDAAAAPHRDAILEKLRALPESREKSP